MLNSWKVLPLPLYRINFAKPSGRTHASIVSFIPNPAGKSGGYHRDTRHSGKKTCERIAEENGVSRASTLRARHYTKGIDIADTLSPSIKKKVFSGEVKFTNDEMIKLVQSSPDKRQDVFAEIMHPEITKAMEAADAEPNADNPIPMPTADSKQFKPYQVPDEFMQVYKTLSTATEMMKNTWKRVFKNNQSYLSDPEKQKVLRFAMQRPALYLNELEACMEQILAETLEESEKTAPAGTARKARGSLPRGRRNKLITLPAKRNRAFGERPVVHIVIVCGLWQGASYSGAHPVFCFALNLLAHGFQPHSSNISPGHHSELNPHSPADRCR